MVIPAGWFQYWCAHCGTSIGSRDEVKGLSYCQPECGEHLAAGEPGECICVAIRRWMKAVGRIA